MSKTSGSAKSRDALAAAGKKKLEEFRKKKTQDKQVKDEVRAGAAGTPEGDLSKVVGSSPGNHTETPTATATPSAPLSSTPVSDLNSGLSGNGATSTIHGGLEPVNALSNGTVQHKPLPPVWDAGSTATASRVSQSGSYQGFTGAPKGSGTTDSMVNGTLGGVKGDLDLVPSLLEATSGPVPAFKAEHKLLGTNIQNATSSSRTTEVQDLTRSLAGYGASDKFSAVASSTTVSFLASRTPDKEAIKQGPAGTPSSDQRSRVVDGYREREVTGETSSPASSVSSSGPTGRHLMPASFVGSTGSTSVQLTRGWDSYSRPGQQAVAAAVPPSPSSPPPPPQPPPPPPKTTSPPPNAGYSQLADKYWGLSKGTDSSTLPSQRAPFGIPKSSAVGTSEVQNHRSDQKLTTYSPQPTSRPPMVPAVHGQYQKPELAASLVPQSQSAISERLSPVPSPTAIRPWIQAPTQGSLLHDRPLPLTDRPHQAVPLGVLPGVSTSSPPPNASQAGPVGIFTSAAAQTSSTSMPTLPRPSSESGLNVRMSISNTAPQPQVDRSSPWWGGPPLPTATPAAPSSLPPGPPLPPLPPPPGLSHNVPSMTSSPAPSTTTAEPEVMRGPLSGGASNNEEDSSAKNATDSKYPRPLLNDFLPLQGPSSTSSQHSSLLAQIKTLQQCIDDLTTEKLEVMRGLQVATKMQEKLSQDNITLSDQYNSQSRRVDKLQQRVEQLEKEVNAQAMAMESMATERDACRLAAQEATDRATALAGEVVELEQERLRCRSLQLKLEKDLGSSQEQLVKVQSQLTKLQTVHKDEHSELCNLRDEKRVLTGKLRQAEVRLKLMEKNKPPGEVVVDPPAQPCPVPKMDQGVQCGLEPLANVMEAQEPTHSRLKEDTSTAGVLQPKAMEEVGPVPMEADVNGGDEGTFAPVVTAASTQLARRALEGTVPAGNVAEIDVLARLKRWLPDSPPSVSADPQSAIVEDEVRVVQSIYSLISDMEEAVRSLQFQLRNSKATNEALRSSQMDMEGKLQQQTERLELALQQNLALINNQEMGPAILRHSLSPDLQRRDPVQSKGWLSGLFGSTPPSNKRTRRALN